MDCSFSWGDILAKPFWRDKLISVTNFDVIICWCPEILTRERFIRQITQRFPKNKQYTVDF